MSKKRVRSTGGAKKPAGGHRPQPARPAGPASKPAGRHGASRASGGRSRAPRLPGDRSNVVTWVAIATAAALLAVTAAGYASGLVGTYFIPRAALSYPLVALLVTLCVVAVRPGVRPFPVDLVDLLAAGFGAWALLSAALSPAGATAWLGYYNRGAGAFFWVALVALFLAARRLLAGRRAEQALALACAALLVLAAVVALAQAGGASTWWGAAGVVDGRVTGTTGNPVTLAGLCLLGVWLVTLALEAQAPLWARVAYAAGAGAGVTCLVLTVSRAAYLGILAAGVALVVVWVLRRSWRRVAIAGLVAVVAVVAAAAYVPAGSDAPSLLGRLADWRVDGALNESDAKRMDLWNEALQATADRPLGGVGAGAFVVADRLYRPTERRIRTPWALASDPHSLPLLLASTMGIVGLSLGLATVVVALLVARRRRKPRERGGEEDGGAVSSARSGAVQAVEESPASAWNGLAATAYLVAAGVFLLVSPLDKVVAFPIALIGGAVLGPASAAGWGRTVPAVRGAAGRAVWWTALVAAVLLVIVTAVAGARYWRADKAFADAARVDVPSQYVSAADLFTWEPFYTLEAGGKVWRQGLADDDEARVEAGRALLERGLDRDPTGPMGYADLARLAIAQGDPAAAVAQAREGLRWNPDHSVLQALWGYAALVAATQLEDEALASSLASELEGLPASTPDAWYWLSEVRRAQGDAAGADEALARAKQLAPKLTARRYEQRLLAR